MSSLFRLLAHRLNQISYRRVILRRHKPDSWSRLCRFGIITLIALFASCTTSKPSYQAALPSTQNSFTTTSYHPTANANPSPLRRDAVGGGFANAGLTGEYFANSNLSGKPTFVRHDVRIDFDWQQQSPSGSISEPYKSFPQDNFSVRWTGQLLPRFSEVYTFTTTADDGIRLYIKEPSQTAWTNVINHWSTTGGKPTNRIGKFKFVANKAYDIKIEYHELKGPAIARVAWSSPNTPQEVIDAASGIATNVYTEGFADVMKTARDQWVVLETNQPVPRDSNGWPMADASCVVTENEGNMQGNYFLQFNGKADITVFAGKFSDYKYDAATNTSTGIVTVDTNRPLNLVLTFKNTYRDAHSGPNTGVTNIKLMRPIARGAQTSYAPNTIFLPVYKQVLQPFIALRSMASTNWNNSVNWSDRTLTTYSTQRFHRQGENEGNGSAWEYRIMLANEVGKDMYINIPETANDDYITKLAQLIKYGSDGKNPYTSPQPVPMFPPLNPNLRVYVEYSNEVWNANFEAWHQNYAATQQAVKDNTLEAQILTYDGNKDANTLWNRRHALRVLEASNLFRRVFGDAAMNQRVRFLLEWQYDNQGWPPTAETQLNFLNDYFNNGDGKQHVTTPHPIHHYLWGGGGANYYNAENEDGVIALLNDSTWNFSGSAGMANYSKFIDGIDLPKSPNDKQQQELPSTTAQIPSLQGAGTASIRVTFPATATTSNVYGLTFYATQPKQSGTAENAPQKFSIYLDDTEINKPGYDNVPHPYQIGNGWNKYYSNTFTAEPGSTHTIRFVGEPQSNGTILLHRLQLASVDAIFKSAFPTNDYQHRLDIVSNWAHLYGLNDAAYEGGWGLGGDAGGSPVQNWAKFNDPRAKQVQLKSINSFYKAGGRIYTFGTYSQWDDWQKAPHEPLIEGIAQSNRQLPPEPTNSVAVPGNLTQNNKVTAWGPIPVDTGKEGQLNLKTIMNWNILVPKTGSYKLTVNSEPGGQLLLLVDDAMTVTSGASGSSTSGNVMLTKGLHTVRVKATSGSFKVNGVNVSSV